MQTNILEQSPGKLEHFFNKLGEKPFRTGQVLRWLYQRQADSFEEMTDIAKGLRQTLASYFTIERLTIADTVTAGDGTKKFLFELGDGQRIETVLIPERDHMTLCVSTQAGCAQACAFCSTGAQGFTRNLTPGEILSQVRDVRHTMENPEALRNLVFMVMGEPLANYDNLLAALHILTDNDQGMRFSGRRVTVSTVGLAHRIPDLGRDTRVKLAVSLNAADDETRSRIMPVNRRYNLDKLFRACKAFPLLPGRRITFEYVLLKGVNDSEADARKLTKLLHGVPAKVNLIPHNPFPGSPFERPSDETVENFRQILINKHYTAVTRKSKGADIAAACGQLRAAKAENGKKIKA